MSDEALIAYAILGAAVSVGIIAVIAMPFIRLYRNCNVWADAEMATIYDEANSMQPCPNDIHVKIEFMTYQGFLNTVRQTPHNQTLPSAKALFLLKRLHAFNLKWAWWGAGGLIFPFYSMWKYGSQKRKILRQIALGPQS